MFLGWLEPPTRCCLLMEQILLAVVHSSLNMRTWHFFCLESNYGLQILWVVPWASCGLRNSIPMSIRYKFWSNSFFLLVSLGINHVTCLKNFSLFTSPRHYSFSSASLITTFKIATVTTVAEQYEVLMFNQAHTLVVDYRAWWDCRNIPKLPTIMGIPKLSRGLE